MLRPPPSPGPAANRRRPALLAGCCLAIAGCLVLVGCGVPPELAEPGSRVPTPRSSGAATPTASPSPSPSPIVTTSPTPDDSIAVSCAGRPSGDQVLTLLRRSPALLPRNTRATVQLGPLCAGGWQYSVVQMSGREPLQVVSKGPAGDLRLVTAGTDVCTIPVRVEAPPGIRSAACDKGPAATTGL